VFLTIRFSIDWKSPSVLEVGKTVHLLTEPVYISSLFFYLCYLSATRCQYIDFQYTELIFKERLSCLSNLWSLLICFWWSGFQREYSRSLAWKRFSAWVHEAKMLKLRSLECLFGLFWGDWIPNLHHHQRCLSRGVHHPQFTASGSNPISYSIGLTSPLQYVPYHCEEAEAIQISAYSEQVSLYSEIW